MSSPHVRNFALNQLEILWSLWFFGLWSLVSEILWSLWCYTHIVTRKDPYRQTFSKSDARTQHPTCGFLPFITQLQWSLKVDTQRCHLQQCHTGLLIGQAVTFVTIPRNGICQGATKTDLLIISACSGQAGWNASFCFFVSSRWAHWSKVGARASERWRSDPARRSDFCIHPWWR